MIIYLVFFFLYPETTVMWLTSSTSASADSDCPWVFRKPNQYAQRAVAPFRVSLWVSWVTLSFLSPRDIESLPVVGQSGGAFLPFVHRGDTVVVTYHPSSWAAQDTVQQFFWPLLTNSSSLVTGFTLAENYGLKGWTLMASALEKWELRKQTSFLWTYKNGTFVHIKIIPI